MNPFDGLVLDEPPLRTNSQDLLERGQRGLRRQRRARVAVTALAALLAVLVVPAWDVVRDRNSVDAPGGKLLDSTGDLAAALSPSIGVDLPEAVVLPPSPEGALRVQFPLSPDSTLTATLSLRRTGPVKLCAALLPEVDTCAEESLSDDKVIALLSQTTTRVDDRTVIRASVVDQLKHTVLTLEVDRPTASPDPTFSEATLREAARALFPALPDRSKLPPQLLDLSPEAVLATIQSTLGVDLEQPVLAGDQDVVSVSGRVQGTQLDVTIASSTPGRMVECDDYGPYARDATGLGCLSKPALLDTSEAFVEGPQRFAEMYKLREGILITVEATKSDSLTRTRPQVVAVRRAMIDLLTV